LKNGNWIGLDKNIVKLLPHGRAYTIIEALVSFSIDIDNKRNWTINGYAKQWGWSRNKVRKFTSELGTGRGHLADRKGTGSGHLITLKVNNLHEAKDTKRTGKGQEEDRKRYTTINPNTKPNPNKEKPSAGFEDFYKAYPKKKSKGQAEKTWNKLSPTNDLLKTMLIAIEAAKTSEDWLKDNGKYIPYPSSWLNAKGWQDEVIEAKDCEVVIDGETVWMTETEYKQWREDNEKV
jgi:hypothetical protein